MTQASPTTSFDRDTVQRLVTEVLRRLHVEAGVAAVVPAQPVAVASGYGAQEAKQAGVSMPDRVITLAVLEKLEKLEKLPSGTRSLVIDAKAVITPSARDYAKESGITLVRAGSAAGGGVAAARPFLIAHADCKGDPAAKAAAIARSVPGSQHIPPSGLAEVIAALSLHASRDAARAILLTGRPAVAAILANRSSSLRAVVGRDVASLAAAAAETQANLLIVDPAVFPGGLERLCADFAGRPAGQVPGELATSAPGCGCKGHAH